MQRKMIRKERCFIIQTFKLLRLAIVIFELAAISSTANASAQPLDPFYP
jgi:hypothetical protein